MDCLFSAPAPLRWGITLLFAAVVVALSVTPGVDRPGDSLFVWLVINTATPVQKLMHIATYAILAGLWMWTLQSVESTVLRLGLAFVATVGMGAVLEWHQTRIAGRFGTVFDVILNTAGAIVGLLLVLFML